MSTQNQDKAITEGLVLVAPESTSKFERKDKNEIQKIVVGNHLARLYGIVDLGEQLNVTFNSKSRRIVLLFEFPHLMQDFYVRKEGEATELQPTMIKYEETYSMHPKANLRKFVESALGKRFSDEEAKQFNIFGLLNQWFTCSVMHDPDKKDANNVYERINFALPYDERFKLPNVNYNGINDLMAYSPQLHNFSGPNWRGLWSKFRTKIQGSTEGQAWAAKGGVFEEVKYNDDNQETANTYAGPASPATNNPMGGGAPAGVPNQPVSPPATTPNAPAAPAKVFTIKTPPLDFALWAAENWTEEKMVQAGHAHYV